LVEQLIRRYRVAVLPGSAFGKDSVHAIRFSYGALDAATVLEGIGRLKRGLLEIFG
jgi:aspartate/methionine/tyrosine aminotransferase